MKKRERYSKVVPVSNLTEGTEVPRLMEQGKSIVAPPNPVVDDWVRDAIEKLPAEQQALLFEHFYERVSHREMAARRGWGSHARVQRHLAKAFVALEAHLLEEATDEDA